MNHVEIKFHKELNYFLKTPLREIFISASFKGRRSVKDLIESFGVPHAEVGCITANRVPVDFTYILNDSDLIYVYPLFGLMCKTESGFFSDYIESEPAFVLDVHLRSLSRKLRLMGFDVDYKEARDDKKLADISMRKGRILLTRDRQLLMHRIVQRGLYVRNTDPELQIVEILKRLSLKELCRPFERCIECNGTIEEFDLFSADYRTIESVPPGVRSWCREFHRCSCCEKIYWKGSHYDKLSQFVKRVMSRL